MAAIMRLYQYEQSHFANEPLRKRPETQVTMRVCPLTVVKHWRRKEPPLPCPFTFGKYKDKSPLKVAQGMHGPHTTSVSLQSWLVLPRMVSFSRQWWCGTKQVLHLVLGADSDKPGEKFFEPIRHCQLTSDRIRMPLHHKFVECTELFWSLHVWLLGPVKSYMSLEAKLHVLLSSALIITTWPQIGQLHCLVCWSLSWS